jgi:hypothetical protein
MKKFLKVLKVFFAYFAIGFIASYFLDGMEFTYGILRSSLILSVIGSSLYIYQHKKDLTE